MATTKSMKIQAEIDKVKAKISEQQARLKELEQKKLEAENSEIVDIVRGMSISLTELLYFPDPRRNVGPIRFHPVYHSVDLFVCVRGYALRDIEDIL